MVIALTITMASFVLTDLFSNTSLLSGQDRTIAEIDGSEITYEDFQARVNELSAVFTLNTGRNPQGDETDQIRNQAWQSLLVDMAYKPQYRAIGFNISNEEIVDMVQGDNTHPHVVQMLGNPQTGQFEKSFVQNFLREMAAAPGPQQEAWVRFESTLAPTRMMMMLDNLMDRTNYVTKAEARVEHQAQNSNVTVEYVYVPYLSMTDSLVEVSQDEMEDYMEENAKEYEREESRDVAYVAFAIQPSAEDSLAVRESMTEAVAGLQVATNDSAFASQNTDGQFPFMTYRVNSMPEVLFDGDQPIAPGSVAGPITLGDRMVAYKMSRIEEGAENYVKARHILIQWEDESDEAKKAAKTKAEDVLRKARSGSDFAVLAAENSDDASNAQRGGDLGWFGENGNFVQEFKDAAFGHSGTGLIPRLVETQFGYHIIKIDEPKTNTQYKVAIIEKEFTVSNQSLEDAYRNASEFQAAVADTDDAASFEAKATEMGFDVRKQNRVTSTAQRVGGLVNARSLVLWLYNTASEGDISEILEIDDQYVVAMMTGMQEKGTARLADVENEVAMKVRNQKKAEMIQEKLAALDGKTFEEMVEGYGKGATTQEATFTLSSNSISGIGIAPQAVGVAFAMTEGEVTKAFDTQNGVVVMKLISKNAAQETDDYSLYLQQLVNRRAARKVMVTEFPLTYFRVVVSQDLDNAIKELSGMEDMRYKFF